MFLRGRLLIKPHHKYRGICKEACEYSVRLSVKQVLAPSPTHFGTIQMDGTVIHCLLQLDFYVDTGRQIELHQRVHCLVSRINDVHQTLVRTKFKLIATGLVHVR